MAATTGTPIVMFGTKWPSMTSTWIQSAPAASASWIASPRRAKSADRIDGAMRTSGMIDSEHAHAVRASDDGLGRDAQEEAGLHDADALAQRRLEHARVLDAAVEARIDHIVPAVRHERL